MITNTSLNHITIITKSLPNHHQRITHTITTQSLPNDKQHITNTSPTHHVTDITLYPSTAHFMWSTSHHVWYSDGIVMVQWTIIHHGGKRTSSPRPAWRRRHAPPRSVPALRGTPRHSVVRPSEPACSEAVHTHRQHQSEEKQGMPATHV